MFMGGTYALKPEECKHSLTELYEIIHKKVTGQEAPNDAVFRKDKIFVTQAVLKKVFDFYVIDMDAMPEEVALIFARFAPSVIESDYPTNSSCEVSLKRLKEELFVEHVVQILPGWCESALAETFEI